LPLEDADVVRIQQVLHGSTSSTNISPLKKNPEFKAFLKQLSQQEATISLESLRQELAL